MREIIYCAYVILKTRNKFTLTTKKKYIYLFYNLELIFHFNMKKVRTRKQISNPRRKVTSTQYVASSISMNFIIFTGDLK